MSQEYKVTKAFLSTVSKEDQTPQVVQTQHGDKHKFMVQVEGQPIAPGKWFGVLKQPGNEIKVGDTIYGDFSENQWGGPQFKAAQRPLDQPRPQPTGQSASSSDLEAKVDLLLELVQLLVERGDVQAGAEAAFPDNNQVLNQPKIDLDDLNL